jgi:hypothetical protein
MLNTQNGTCTVALAKHKGCGFLENKNNYTFGDDHGVLANPKQQ